MTEPTLKIEKTWTFKSEKRPTAIFVIGAGGTGSYFVPMISRDIHTMETPPSLVLCDGDVVEEKNLKRQHFIASDIGKNKAAALAGRYSAAFGISVGYKDEFIETKEAFIDLLSSGGGNVIVVTCVDNIKTRLLLREAIAEVVDFDVFWIDCGNEAYAGQAVLAARCPWWAPHTIEQGRFPMPDVFDLYPELFERAKQDKLPTEMSCAELAESSPQYGFVNLLSSTVALNWAHDLLYSEPIRTNVVEFSIKNKYRHTPLIESNIEAWKCLASFGRFNDFKYFQILRKKKAKAADKAKMATEATKLSNKGAEANELKKKKPILVAE